MIEISHLTKKYGDHVAVNDLTLNIEPGRIYGFLGPNGAGKSTTMNMITGYIAATQGTVKVNGYDILKQPEEARKCIGYLPEMPPLYMDMTVYEYLKFAADLKRLPKDKKRQYIEESMEMTKITDIKNRLIRNLSKGYRQRTGFAQAVLGYPQIMILDEPTAGLDPKQMIEIRELIKSLGKRHTVILSSHILTEIKEVCEHIFIISKGRLAASDTTQHLIERTSEYQEIQMLIKGSEQAVWDALKEMEGLAECSLMPGSEEGLTQAVLKGSRGTDIRERVFYAFASAGIPILEMTAGHKSLEQVFLELTQTSDEKTEKQEEGSDTASGTSDGEKETEKQVLEAETESLTENAAKTDPAVSEMETERRTETKNEQTPETADSADTGKKAVNTKTQEAD